jgi:N-methylhydantoinase A
MSASGFRIGVDTGGTFTDLIAVREQDGAIRTAKVASTPREPVAAVVEALRRTGLRPDEAAFFVLGTTIATNCLLERKGGRTVYVTTAGFEDIPFIQRINRKGLYDLQWVKSKPYVERRDCIGVHERVAFDGTVRVALADDEVERVVGEVRRRASEGEIAVALNLLFAFVNPSHERGLAEALRSALPEVPVSVSHEVAPIWREWERGSTVITDAYLRRLVERFASDLATELDAYGLNCPRLILKSNGGQTPVAAAARQPVNLILSGLAGGLIGGKHFASAVGRDDVITLDMGGTSADIGLIQRGAIRSSNQYEFEFGMPVAVPVVDLTTIGAGGSSIAGFDEGGFLRVGPSSAGAEPGPAAYGRGGTEPTVTDANLVLGRLNPAYFLGGELSLDLEAARAALRPVAARLGVPLEEAAQAVVDVAVQNMANAIRLLTADRGLDYRRFDLMGFGGAGPLHASLIARRLGLARVIVPPSPGLTSAFGALVADLRVDRRITRIIRTDQAEEHELRAVLQQAADEAMAELSAEGELRAPILLLTASCRYVGQNFEQDVALTLDDPQIMVTLVERFHRNHESVYGYRLDDAVVEIVHVNAVAIDQRQAPAAGPPLAAEAAPSSRPIFLGGQGWVDATVHRRSGLRVGDLLPGPAIVEEVDSTTLVLEDEVARVHESGSLILENREVGAGQRPERP